MFLEKVARLGLAAWAGSVAVAHASPALQGTPQSHGITYPIVFVDAPRNGSPPAAQGGAFSIPEVDFPEIAGNPPSGALRTRETKLKMLHPDGSVETLFGTPTGAVLYPSVSFDGTKIYFAFHPDLTNDANRYDVYRMDWEAPGHPVENLTAAYTQFAIFDDDGSGPNGLTPADVDATQYLGYGQSRRPIKVQFWNPFEVLDSDGRIRVMAVSSWNAERMAKSNQNVGDLVVMDLDGSKLRTFLHVPGGAFFAFQSPTGEIYWGEFNEHFSRRSENNFSIMKCAQDGTNHQQFDRFHIGFFDIGAAIRNTQSLSVHGIDIVGSIYYAGNNAGWGALQAVPDNLPGLDFSTNDAVGDAILHAPIVRKERTFVTFGKQLVDDDGPNPLGKFRDPAPAQGERMLAAFSPGPATFHPTGGPAPFWQRWDAKIVLFPNGTKTLVSSPDSLVVLHDSSSTQSFMPRQVAPYEALYGVPFPSVMESPNRNDGASGILPPGSPYAIARGASLHVGETATAPNAWALHWHFEPNGVPTPKVFNPGWSFGGGGWPLPRNFQGYENGEFSPSDVRYLRVLTRKRILGTVPYIDTGMDGAWDDNTWFKAGWEILGEFDVRAGKSDPDDSSYVAKIPADTPVMFQALDKYGMTLTSETFLREHKAGSVVTCAGCHARGIEGVAFESTEAASAGFPVHDAVSDHRIVVPNFQAGTAAATPLVTETPQIWFFEDVKGIFGNCVSCHRADAPGGAAAQLDLRDQVVNGKTLYERLAKDFEVANPEGYDPVYTGGTWHAPNLSRYVKAGSARESLLVWKLVGPLVGNASQRLDGRSNAFFPTESPPGSTSLGTPPNGLNFLVDVDNLHAGCAAHSFVQSGSISNETVAKLVRWIDLGAPSNDFGFLPPYKGIDKDYEPPAAGIHVDVAANPPIVRIGAWDETSLDVGSARLRILGTGLEAPLASIVPQLSAAALEEGIAFPYPIPLEAGQTTEFSIKDGAGNLRRVQFDCGCAPQGGGITLTASSPTPAIGSQLLLTVNSPFPGLLAQLAGSQSLVSSGQVHLGQCTTLVPDVTMLTLLAATQFSGTLDAAGSITWAHSIPASPALVGESIHLSALVYSGGTLHGASHPPTTITFTNDGQPVVQDPAPTRRGRPRIRSGSGARLEGE
jgi:hypothetical protein